MKVSKFREFVSWINFGPCFVRNFWANFSKGRRVFFSQEFCFWKRFGFLPFLFFTRTQQKHTEFMDSVCVCLRILLKEFHGKRMKVPIFIHFLCACVCLSNWIVRKKGRRNPFFRWESSWTGFRDSLPSSSSLTKTPWPNWISLGPLCLASVIARNLCVPGFDSLDSLFCWPEGNNGFPLFFSGGFCSFFFGPQQLTGTSYIFGLLDVSSSF